MQLVVLALLGSCVIVNSASLSSDTITVSKSKSLEDKSTSSHQLEESASSELSPDDGIREKRSGLGGSGGFLAGIGSAILGKVAQASSGISSGSSQERSHGYQYESVEYGPPVHHYEEENFDIWSFKKAILNTLFQALKAIGGGVIALKGKLIKGGGVVISAKGNIISAKGEAISTLGRHIAASAILSPPKASNSHAYEAPIHVTSHDSYAGPPPISYGHHGGYAASASSDSYEHTGYASPSDDADHPGLLIVKPLKPETSHHGSYDTSYHGETESHNQHPLALLSQSFGGGHKSSLLGNIFSKFAGASKSNGPDSFGKGEVTHSVEHVEHKEHVDHHPAVSYGPAGYDNGDDHGHGHGHGHEVETHVVHTEENSNGGIHDDGVVGSLESSVASHGLDNSQQNDHHHSNQYQSQNLGFGTAGQLTHDSFSQIQGNGPVLFSMPLEMPVLQSYNQPSYYSAAGINQLQDYNIPHNTYNSVMKRSHRTKTQPPIAAIRIVPAVGYKLKNSRGHRI